MITFKKLGKYGNLGNQLHQVASLIGLADKYNCEVVIPAWKYASYFSLSILQQDVEADMLIEHPPFEYNPAFWNRYKQHFLLHKVDILGYLQSEKFWAHCRKKVLQQFTFKQWLVDELQTKYAAAFAKPIIALSVRRGDFVTNPNFYTLPHSYYLKALQRFFINSTDYNVLIFSDDAAFCKQHFSSLPNVFFATGEDAIRQLCLMSLCQHFIISNSTFSWWGAMLGEKEGTVIIRSPFVFSGKLAHLNIRDYFPDRWICFNHETDKVIQQNFQTNKAVQLLQLAKKPFC